MNPKIEQQIQLLERQLHSPDVRADPDKLKALLHDDFNEIGRSSQVYHKADIISHVVDGIHFPTIESQNFQFKQLSQTVV